VYAPGSWRPFPLRLRHRDPQRTAQTQTGPVHAVAGAPAASTTDASSTGATLYLGIGAGAGGVILIAIIVLVVQIIRKRRAHRRALADFDIEHPVPVRQIQDIGPVPRPVSVARCGSLAPLHAQAGWGALSSDESIHAPETALLRRKSKRSSISLPKRFRQQGLPLTKLKHLSAIIESPRSRSTNSPPPTTADDATAIPKPLQTVRETHAMGQLADVDEADDVFVCPGSPKPDVLPSFAIRSPGMYGAAIANDEKPRPPRSVSVGALAECLPDGAVFGHASRLSRPKMHARSISLGAPQTLPPSGPVPPLPVIAPHALTTDYNVRQDVCTSRTSTSSQGSGHSSVLVTSPILKLHEDGDEIKSPSVEDMVAQDDGAQLKTVVNRQWQNPLITGPRSMDPSKDGTSDPMPSRTHASVRSKVAHYSADSQWSHRLSTASTESMDSRKNRLSVPQLATADRVSISRVSSSESLTGAAKVQKVITPRRSSRQSNVSITGSPGARKKTCVLREISGNTVTPSRQASSATQDSGRSSNGNPFQWDQPLPKPSALKGSPNARKGHRRQNCVRISTLTPQVLGPPPSRPISPSVMQDIEEEPADEEGSARSRRGGQYFVPQSRLPRPTSASSLANHNPRVQTLRASLTPSSPTLSAWTAYQEQEGLPSQPSDTQLSFTRTASRQSERSSACSIPVFPSPSKATVSKVQMEQPVPEFCLSRPSTDEPGSSSPFAFDFSSPKEMPSSPPLPVSKHREYDPALSAVTIPAPTATQEYDPASPAWDDAEPERSSLLFPFATSAVRDDAIAGQTLSTAHTLPDTPPCSPKSLPEGFRGFFGQQNLDSKASPSTQRLTSANASSMMASMVTASPAAIAGFPGAPILAPPREANPQTTPVARRQRAVSSAAHLQATRPAPPPPTSSSDACMPSPLALKPTPLGPRTEPAKSVLKNAMALRRMNSEIDHGRTHEARRYTRLGREASPLLPWIGSPDPSESCNDMFDFGFDHADFVGGGGPDAAAGAEEGTYEKSALDEIDMTDLDRCLEGALAGFNAEPSVASASSPSVWEHGEKFWERQPEFAFTPSSARDVGDVTPTGNKARTDLRLTPTSTSLQMPLPPRSICKTPKSLYDSDGFLRT